jgi:hypothetical protein
VQDAVCRAAVRGRDFRIALTWRLDQRADEVQELAGMQGAVVKGCIGQSEESVDWDTMEE